MNTGAPLAILVPTRNRSLLTVTALKSVLSSSAPIALMVSDNSTSETERAFLAAEVRRLDDPRVWLVTPPGELTMSDHWEWAIGRLLDSVDSDAVSILTDRMLFKPGGLEGLLSLLEHSTSSVLSYRADEVDDTHTPPRLHMAECTGDIYDLSSDRVLELAARGFVGEWLPRFLNSAVRRPVLHEIRLRFGSLFDSISPDFCFAFRCLAVERQTSFLDRSLLVQHGRQRSNGAAFAAGRASVDHADFLSMSGGSIEFRTPEPRFMTVANAIFHEYASVRAIEGMDAWLPTIDLKGYLEANARELPAIVDKRSRSEMDSLLAAHGFTGLSAARARARRVSRSLRLLARPRVALARVRRLFEIRLRRADAGGPESPQDLLSAALTTEGPRLRRPVDRWAYAIEQRTRLDAQIFDVASCPTASRRD